MFNYFAHAGHDHGAEVSPEASPEPSAAVTGEKAYSHTEQNVASVATDHTPVIAGGTALVVLGAGIIVAAVILGNKRTTKKKKPE